LKSPPVKLGEGEGIGKDGIALKVGGGAIFSWDVKGVHGDEGDSGSGSGAGHSRSASAGKERQASSSVPTVMNSETSRSKTSSAVTASTSVTPGVKIGVDGSEEVQLNNMMKSGLAAHEKKFDASGASGHGANTNNDVEEGHVIGEKEGYLGDVDFEVPKGALVAIIGAVGAGKSSLLNAIVGEMKRVKGSVEYCGRMGYCPQTAWIQNSTLRDNILFGKDFDPVRYHAAVRDCALARDFQVLPAGDMTEIGERGINLSGGQKQRVSLARAVYFDADIILLDDPLSAVDSHVGRYLMENCILGALKTKTRILVTHQLHFLPNVDYIYLMEHGRIVERGTYNELMERGKKFTELMKEYGQADEAKDDDIVDDGVLGEDVLLKDEVPKEGGGLDGDLGDVVGGGGLKKRSKEEEAADGMEKIAEEKDSSKDGALMQAEDRAIGAVGGAVFYQYMMAAGGVLAALITLLLLIMAQLARLGTDLWLTWWLSVKWSSISNSMYLNIYVIWGCIQAVTALASGIVFAYAGALASKRLHDRALLKEFRAPMEFFDTTPLGRVLNRFSKDVDTLDSLLPESARLFGYTFSLVLGTVLLICAIFPYFIAALVPAVVLYSFLQNYYRATSRELKRLDNVTRSPLFAHFSACFSGLATIRAYGVEELFSKKNRELLDWNNRAYYPLLLTQRWLGMRLEFIASLLIFFAALFAVAARFTVGPGLAGLAISYSLQVTGVLNWAVRVATETEQNMVSAERLLSFDELKAEAPEVIPENRPPKGTFSNL
ncbi:hypothetical protein HDU76_007719, partial [Blyttiomyces sp. JEL0837]